MHPWPCRGRNWTRHRYAYETGDYRFESCRVRHILDEDSAMKRTAPAAEPARLPSGDFLLTTRGHAPSTIAAAVGALYRDEPATATIALRVARAQALGLAAVGMATVFCLLAALIAAVVAMSRLIDLRQQPAEALEDHDAQAEIAAAVVAAIRHHRARAPAGAGTGP